MKLKKILNVLMIVAFSLAACKDNVANADTEANNQEELSSVEKTEDKIEDIDKEVTTSELSNLAIGQDNIKFGKFIWRVLDIKDGKALLLTNDIVEGRPYNKSCELVTWEDSTIRDYLNNQFLTSNFSQEEQGKIIESTITNPDNEWFGTEGGEDTQDKIFLLSIEEAVRYFGDSGQLVDKSSESEYFIDDEYNDARIATLDGEPEWWFLRSPGGEDGRAADVSDVGPLIIYGDCSNAAHGIRPALWVTID